LRWLWIVALIVLLAVGAAVLWVVFSGSDEQPTLTFDGTVATYSGPVTLEAGLVTFKLENTSDETMGFYWGLLSDDSITMEDEIQSDRRPSWYADTSNPGQAGPGAVVEQTTRLPEGRITLLAWGNVSQTRYPAAIIDVESG